ncbi:MAG: cryptochrome/photolyase family protein [Phycisphaerales bacterium]
MTTPRPPAPPFDRLKPPIVWLFEDQLSHDSSVLTSHPDSPVLLIESDRAFRRVRFHKKRLVFLVSAMRHFAAGLRSRGRVVHHYPLTPRGYKDSMDAIRDVVRATGSGTFVVMEPSEHHTREWLNSATGKLGVSLHFVPNTLFLTDRVEFGSWASSVKSPLMETFYRRQRRRYNVLMDSAGPAGGSWNLDKDNRKAFPRGLLVPPIPGFPPDAITREVMSEIDRRFADHPGSTDGFDLPVTRTDAQRLFNDFLKHRLPLFGDYEDAMVTGQPVLFHSLISPLINAGLIGPLECVRAAERRYREGKAPLNSAEGFVRQILGWREYVYGIYWSFMPEYRARNVRGDSRPLPRLFWDGRTQMNCLRQCIGGVVDRAYSHHIQRLMVIGNFATLCGLSPQAVNDWFYAMYVDSHDWVVTPNVIGMAMNADGGTMATKPYISSAAYINRMSDYCSGCRYDPERRTGEGACPFNALYWSFLHEQRESLARNQRMAMMLKNLDRIPKAELEAMIRAKRAFLDLLD